MACSRCVKVIQQGGVKVSPDMSGAEQFRRRRSSQWCEECAKKKTPRKTQNCCD